MTIVPHKNGNLVKITLSITLFIEMIFRIRKVVLIILLMSGAVFYLHASGAWRSIQSRNVCVIVLRESDGRLGNQMFMYASAFGLALRHRCHMYVESKVLKKLQSTFYINPARLIPHEQFLLLYISRQLYNGCKFYMPVIHDHSRDIVELTGYWQNYRYFNRNWEEIRRQFTFKENIFIRLSQQLRRTNDTIFRTISQVIDQVYGSNYYLTMPDDRSQAVKHRLKLMNRTLIGVHIRRGDFVHKKHLGFTVSSSAYILRGFMYFSQKYPDATFIIVSDDKKWCQTNIADYDNRIISPEALSPSEDMALLTLCEHSLITTGTFGWWVATLTGGTVVCDKSYPKTNSWLSDLCPAEQYYPPWFKRL